MRTYGTSNLTAPVPIDDTARDTVGDARARTDTDTRLYVRLMGAVWGMRWTRTHSICSRAEGDEGKLRSQHRRRASTDHSKDRHWRRQCR